MGTLPLIIGLLLGLVAGPFAGPVAPLLSEVSKWVVQLIKAVAVPLLFFAVVNAVHSTEVRLKSGLRMVGIAAINATLALTIGILLSHWLRPGDALRELWRTGLSGDLMSAISATAPTANDLKLDWMKNLGSWIPDSTLKPFVDNAVIPVILLALLLGLAIRGERKHQARQAHPKEEEDALTRFSNTLALGQRLSERILFFITRAIPFAVFGAVSSAVARFGYGPLSGLFPYLGVALLGLTLHILITYQGWIRLICKRSLLQFWSEARTPVVQSIGTNSSLATLPFTLRALDRLGVSRQASALGACVGTNLNNDGILLYEGMAFLTVAQAMGMDLTLSQQLSAAVLCMLTGMGVAGVPDAGFISLSLVLTAVGLPIENLPLLLSVDWILGRARSVTNVLSDMTLSVAIDGPKKSASK
jgi:Na+/H+-dicarboxylate symporter